MKAYFWGTRGSVPSSAGAGLIRGKIRQALAAALEHGLGDAGAIDEFIDSRLPFSVRGTYGTNTSCVQVNPGSDEPVLCDAGTGLRDFGNHFVAAKSAGGPGRFHIFLSHPHWDHIQGFPFFAPAYVPGNRICVYGCHDDIERAFAGQQRSPYFPVAFKDMAAAIDFVRLDPGREYALAGLQVRAIEQEHPGRSYGYRFDSGGKAIVYSGDCEHRPDCIKEGYGFLDFCRNADLLVFDAQYTFAEACTSRESWGHSSNLIGVELAKSAGVRHLCLFHHEPTIADDVLDKLHRDTVQYGRIFDRDRELLISVAYDGMEIAV